MSTQYDREQDLKHTKVGNMTLHQFFTAIAITKMESPTFYMGTTETEASLKQWAERCTKVADTIISQLAKK